ncbi:MAG TPA: GAF domain-containing protein [Anaerolineales bacterium]|nr:GAF domain-containing protein [Anaerolineales bacterium]
MNETKQPTPDREDRVSRTAFWGTLALALIDVLSCSYLFSVLYQQTRTPVTYTAMAVFLLAIITALTSFVLTLRHRQELAAKLLFAIIFVIGFSAVGLFEGRTLSAALSILLIAVMVIRWLFPDDAPRRRYLAFAIAGFLLMWLIEWIHPSWRTQLDVPELGPAAVIGFGVILVSVIVRQTWSSLSLRWKMGGIVAILSLGLAVVAYAGYVGLQSLRYQLSNIYDFMLVPIVAINNGDSALADAQIKLENLDEVEKSAVAQNIADITANNKLAGDVIQQYDTEWVTTLSPEFTQALREAGKLNLQQQELEILARLHTNFDSYLLASDQYTKSIEAGQPEPDLAISSGQSLQASRAALQELIDVNNAYADFSNLEAQSAHRFAIASGALALGLALLLGLFLSSVIVASITSRLNGLTRFAVDAQQGKLDQRIDLTGNDEITVLGSAFNEMTSKLRESFATLEQRVADRTRNLELAAEVGRSVSQVHALDVMLKDAAELIRSQFDLYYVQVYLTDPSQTNLLLLSGTGKVGEQLVGRGHRLQLNTGSINGRAATEKKSVVIADTAASATFRPNPLLPNTRSEMAVPLIVGEKVVGVLDLQSEKANSLTQGLLPAFEALAGQVAIAIQNANLLAEAEQARAEVEAQARRLVRANWADYQDAIHKPEVTGFVFEQNKISAMAPDEAIKENSLVAAISVTGETLGNLVVEMEGQSSVARTPELVDTIARQVAQHIESLRLLESAERYRAESEQASRRLTREGWKNYMEANTDENLSYLYDLKEVRPYSNGDNHTEEANYILPLKVRDETVGKLAVEGLTMDDRDSLELANAVAERLSAHIESLRQADQTQSALAQSEKLFDASRGLTQATDLQELVLAAVTTLNIPVVNRALLAVFNYAPDGKMEGMRVAANWWNGTGHEATAIGTYYSSEALKVLSIFTSPTPIFFNDMYTDKRVDAASLEVVKRLNVRAMVGLPLFVGPRQIGTLILEAEEVHNFSQEDIRLFTALAPQIATLLESRRQFEQAQKQAERESMLNTISQKIQSATSVEAVLQIAARELGHALSAPMTIAQLSMKEKS